LQKTYVREDGTTVLICPFCRHARAVSVDILNNKKNHINHSQKNDRGMLIRGKITVKGVSMGGIGFETAGNCSMQKDVELEVIFTFDDIHSYFIKKMLLVKVVRDKYVGCEFSDSKEYVKALGFYLRP
jgi:hypothetical protein